MTFATLLINSAQIERSPSSGATTFGNPTKVWANHLSAQDCRLSSPSGREVQNGTEVIQVDEQLFMNDVDVVEGDRITVDTVLYEIVFVAVRQNGTADHHKELGLVRVKP